MSPFRNVSVAKRHRGMATEMTDMAGMAAAMAGMAVRNGGMAVRNDRAIFPIGQLGGPSYIEWRIVQANNACYSRLRCPPLFFCS